MPQHSTLIKLVKKWRWAAAYILLIFLTTPLLPDLVRAVARLLGLNTKELLISVKVFVVTVISTALPLYLYQSGRHKDKNCWIVLFVIGVVGSLLVANLGSPVDATHFLEYSGLSMVVFYTLAKDKQKPLSKTLYYQAVLITLLVGVVDEIYQGYLPNRYYDFNDIITNTVSGALGLLFLWGIIKPHKEAGLPVDNTG